MLMGSVWMIGESKMRQILVPNASGLATSCFIMLMLCPLPISLYVNNLQKGKYKKIFQPICFIALLNFIICTILHLTGVADYIETMPAAHAILIITSLLSFLLSGSDIGIIGVEVIACCSLDCLLQCFL